MPQGPSDQTNGSDKLLLNANGKIYFRKDTERRFFFVLTIIMLGFGILSHIGLF